MLISKDENIKTSSVYVGYLILRQFKKSKSTNLTIFDIYEKLKKEDIIHYRQVFFGLSFLYCSGIIDFQEPYIYLIKNG